MYVCMHICICMYVCMFVCLHVCLFVCLFVCMQSGNEIMLSCKCIILPLLQNGTTPLLWAISTGATMQCVKLLLEKGAQVNLPNKV